jgi:hypothetical protein
MKTTTVSISYSRKFNLGNYESIELGCSLWAQVDGDEDSEAVTQFLYLQAKQAVKEAAMPVLRDSEYRPAKLKQQKRFMNQSIEEIKEEEF